MPFGELNTFYSSMIHLNDSTILIAAHETSPGEEMRALYLRKGRIKDYVTTSVTRLKSPFYQVTVSNRNIHIRGLSGNETVQISQVAGCAVLVVKKVLSEEYSFRTLCPGVYIVRIINGISGKTAYKIMVND